MNGFCKLIRNWLQVYSFLRLADRAVGNGGFAGGINWADMVR